MQARQRPRQTFRGGPPKGTSQADDAEREVPTFLVPDRSVEAGKKEGVEDGEQWVEKL